MRKKRNVGLILQIVQIVVVAVVCAVVCLIAVNIESGENVVNTNILAILPTIVVVGFYLIIIYLVGTINGRKNMKTNTWMLTVCTVFTVCTMILGIFGLIGTIMVRKDIKERQESEAAARRVTAQQPSIIAQQPSVARQTEISANAPEKAVDPFGMDTDGADAEEKTLKDSILYGHATSIDMIREDGAEWSVTIVDHIYSSASGKNELYALVTPSDGKMEEFHILLYSEEGDGLLPVEPDLEDIVYEEWKEKHNKEKAEMQNEEEKSDGKQEKLVLDLYDTIVSERDWKSFRKSATQEELAVLAIGSKYRLSGVRFFLKAVVSVIGTILSVIIGIVTAADMGVFSIFILVGGYLFFNLMACKLAGYSDTYGSCYRKLNKEYKEFVSSFFRDNVFVSLLRTVVLLLLRIFIIPYRMILFAITLFIPRASDWATAHGGLSGAVVSIPKGYDIGCLGAIGKYYESCSFTDAYLQHIEDEKAMKRASTTEYEYVDNFGVRRKAYSSDGRYFYDSPDCTYRVGTSDDGGRNIKLDNPDVPRP